MKSLKLVTSPTAWLSAALAYGTLLGWTATAAVVVPILIEVLREHPRLAVLGGLGLWLAPILAVAVVHHAVHAVLDGLDVETRAKGIVPGAASFWAGLFTWFVLLFASSVTNFVVLLVEPPRPPDPDALLRAFTALRGSHAMFATGTWLALAALLYAFEGAVRPTRAPS